VTESIGWVIATLALAGWTATLVFLSKALLPLANAFKVQVGIDEFVNKQLTTLLDRRDQIEQRKKMASKPPEPKEQPVSEAEREIQRLFGPQPFVAEQPDALEVVT
jgi:hypothetical protein